MQENEIMYVYLYIFLLPSVTNGDFATQSIRSGKTKGQGKERSNAEARGGQMEREKGVLYCGSGLHATEIHLVTVSRSLTFHQLNHLSLSSVSGLKTRSLAFPLL